MSEDETKIETKPAAKPAPIQYGARGLTPQSLDEAYRLAQYMAVSGFAPKGMERPETILIAMQYGAEIGLTPAASLQNIAIVNGRPSIYGDAALALVRGSGLLESYSQSLEGDGDNHAAVVVSKRKGGDTITTRFSVTDAKRAGLWGKAGPWTQYPARMLTFRARGFNLRDNFPDVLRGVAIREESEDIARAEVISVSGPIAPAAEAGNRLMQLEETTTSNIASE